MKKRNLLHVAMVGAFAAMASTGAQAISFSDGPWKLDINGTINGFYVQGTQKYTAPGVAEVKTDQANVQNGLLPGWINFVATTQQNGLDVKAHFGFAPGIQSFSPINGLPSTVSGNISDAYSKVDTRNAYLQFGNNNWGSLKFGRDIGLFMQNPILADMTLLGVGGTVRAAEPFNTSFGMIGHGYTYVGFVPQITYTTPDLSGFKGSFALVNPSTFSPATGTERKEPQFQGLLSFDWTGPVNGKVWGSGIYNKTSGTGGTKGEGFEGGVKVGFTGAPVELVLSGFSNKGLGISTIGAQFLVVPDVNGDRLKSKGGLAQVTFKPMPDVKLGVSYGENRDKNLIAASTETKNKAAALGVYYSLTPSITLVGEYINEKGTNTFGGVVGDELKSDSVSLGAILFF